MREKTLDINRKYENNLFLTVDRADIMVEHHGQKLTSKAVITCVNNNIEAVNKVILTLNPGLEVSEISAYNRSYPFTRENHVIVIDPSRDINPGDTIELSINYSGKINEAYCYPWYRGNLKDNEVRNGPIPIGQRQLFLYSDYVLLSSETNWYPIASLNYYPSNPARIKVDFTKYSLSVKNKEGLTAISQGTGSIMDGSTHFSNQHQASGYFSDNR